MGYCAALFAFRAAALRLAVRQRNKLGRFVFVVGGGWAFQALRRQALKLGRAENAERTRTVHTETL